MTPGATLPSRAREATGWLPVGDGGAYAFVSRPEAPSGAGCVLLAPLADERKSSLRATVEIARALAARGIVALRIDYRGTGDSSGRSEGLSLASMLEDAEAAARCLREEHGCGKVALAGLRLGGAVALLAAGRARADAVAMIEPVVNGESYVRELRRRLAIRRMLTKGRGSGAADEAAAGPFDLDGTALDAAFVAEIESVDLVGAAGAVPPDDVPASLVLQVGPRKAPSRENSLLAEALSPRARLAVVRAEPFWLQTDYVGPGRAAEELGDFLGRALLGEATATAGPEGKGGGE